MNDESFKDLRRTDNKAGTSEEMLRRSVHLTDLGFSPEFVADFMGDKSHLEHNIDAKLSNLKIAGFENPVALVEKNPQILNLSFEENIKAKLENLKKAGFENPVKLVEKFPTILNYSFEENIKPKLVDLENAGFSNPVTLIEKNPNILGYSFDESIKPKLADLKNAGFENPVKLVEKFPSILSFSMEENIKPKLVDLKNAGFVDPIALIEKNPQILGNSFDESIKPKLADLKIAGFENPVKLVEKFPQILSLSMEENTIPKLSDLKNAGFVDPVALIEKSPSILGLSMEENIKPKLELAQIVIDTYGITTYKAPEIFETFPQLFGLKRVKMEIVARVLRDKVEAPKDLTPKQLARIFIRPIEDIVLSYPTSGDKKMFLNELVKKVKESSKNKDKNAKRQKIEALLERDANGKVILGDPLTNIVLKYLRDYPEKKGGKKI